MDLTFESNGITDLTQTAFIHAFHADTPGSKESAADLIAETSKTLDKTVGVAAAQSYEVDEHEQFLGAS